MVVLLPRPLSSSVVLGYSASSVLAMAPSMSMNFYRNQLIGKLLYIYMSTNPFLLRAFAFSETAVLLTREDNCEFISNKDDYISVVTDRNPKTGEFRAFVLRSNDDLREPLISSDPAETLHRALDSLLIKTCEAVYHYRTTNGFSNPPDVKKTRFDADDDAASAVSGRSESSTAAFSEEGDSSEEEDDDELITPATSLSDKENHAAAAVAVAPAYHGDSIDLSKLPLAYRTIPTKKSRSKSTMTAAATSGSTSAAPPRDHRCLKRDLDLDDESDDEDDAHHHHQHHQHHQNYYNHLPLRYTSQGRPMGSSNNRASVPATTSSSSSRAPPPPPGWSGPPAPPSTMRGGPQMMMMAPAPPPPPPNTGSTGVRVPMPAPPAPAVVTHHHHHPQQQQPPPQPHLPPTSTQQQRMSIPMTVTAGGVSRGPPPPPLFPGHIQQQLPHQHPHGPAPPPPPPQSAPISNGSSPMGTPPSSPPYHQQQQQQQQQQQHHHHHHHSHGHGNQIISASSIPTPPASTSTITTTPTTTTTTTNLYDVRLTIRWVGHGAEPQRVLERVRPSVAALQEAALAYVRTHVSSFNTTSEQQQQQLPMGISGGSGKKMVMWNLYAVLRQAVFGGSAADGGAYDMTTYRGDDLTRLFAVMSNGNGAAAIPTFDVDVVDTARPTAAGSGVAPQQQQQQQQQFGM